MSDYVFCRRSSTFFSLSLWRPPSPLQTQSLRRLKSALVPLLRSHDIRGLFLCCILPPACHSLSPPWCPSNHPAFIPIFRPPVFLSNFQAFTLRSWPLPPLPLPLCAPPHLSRLPLLLHWLPRGDDEHHPNRRGIRFGGVHEFPQPLADGCLLCEPKNRSAGASSAGGCAGGPGLVLPPAGIGKNITAPVVTEYTWSSL